MKTSVTGAGGLGVEIVRAKIDVPPKRRPPRSVGDRDDEAPDEQAPPPPGMGKLVDKTA